LAKDGPIANIGDLAAYKFDISQKAGVRLETAELPCWLTMVITPTRQCSNQD